MALMYSFPPNTTQLFFEDHLSRVPSIGQAPFFRSPAAGFAGTRVWLLQPRCQPLPLLHQAVEEGYEWKVLATAVMLQIPELLGLVQRMGNAFSAAQSMNSSFFAGCTRSTSINRVWDFLWVNRQYASWQVRA